MKTTKIYEKKLNIETKKYRTEKIQKIFEMYKTIKQDTEKKETSITDEEEETLTHNNTTTYAKMK